MKKGLVALVLLWMGLALSCGRKGPILPPLSKTPQPAKNLTFKQTGDTLRISWEPPEATLSGMPLDPAAFVEIYMAFYPIVQEQPAGKEEAGGETAGEKPPPSLETGPPAGFDFERESYLMAIVRRSRDEAREETEVQPGLPRWFDLKLDKPEYFSKGLVFAALVRDGRNRKSAYSELHSFRPKALSLPPGNLNFFVREEAVTIVWNPPPANIDGSIPAVVSAYNLFRSEGDGEYLKLTDKPVKVTKFEDKSFVFGSTYLYILKALPDEDSDVYESGFSHALEVMVKDTFPPSIPGGLDYISGGGMISLSWEVGPERDLAGYMIYRRRVGEADFKALTPQPVIENAYSDSTAEKGIRYEFTVTAVDRSGNESARSSVIRAEIR